MPILFSIPSTEKKTFCRIESPIRFTIQHQDEYLFFIDMISLKGNRAAPDGRAASIESKIFLACDPLASQGLNVIFQTKFATDACGKISVENR